MITLSELDALTNTTLSSDYPSAYLTPIINSVSTRVQEYCGYIFPYTDFVDKEVPYRIENTSVVFLIRDRPLVTLSAATWQIQSTGDNITIDLTNRRLDLGNSLVYIPAIRAWSSWLTVPSGLYGTKLLASYRSGYGSVPDGVKRAIALLVQERVLSAVSAASGQSGQLQSFRNLDYSETYFPAGKDASPLGMGTLLSRMAAEELVPYGGPRVGVAGGG